jgi:hypothetical protein
MYKGNYSEFAQKLIPFMDGIKYFYTKTNFKIFLSKFFCRVSFSSYNN